MLKGFLNFLNKLPLKQDKLLSLSVDLLTLWLTKLPDSGYLRLLQSVWLFTASQILHSLFGPCHCRHTFCTVTVSSVHHSLWSFPRTYTIGIVLPPVPARSGCGAWMKALWVWVWAAQSPPLAAHICLSDAYLRLAVTTVLKLGWGTGDSLPHTILECHKPHAQGILSGSGKLETGSRFKPCVELQKILPWIIF